MARENANELRYLANKNYRGYNSKKDIGIAIGSSYWNSDGYWTQFYIRVPLLKFFSRWKNIGYVVGPADREPWLRLDPGLDELKPACEQLLKEAISHATSRLGIIKQQNDVDYAKRKAYNQQLAKKYLKDE